MRKRKLLPNMMDNEVVEVLYRCVKYAENINFDEIAKKLGLQDASKAKDRVTRVMKAQKKKPSAAPASAPIGNQSKVGKITKVSKARIANGGTGGSQGGRTSKGCLQVSTKETKVGKEATEDDEGIQDKFNTDSNGAGHDADGEDEGTDDSSIDGMGDDGI